MGQRRQAISPRLSLADQKHSGRTGEMMADLSNLELAENARLNLQTYLRIPEHSILRIVIEQLDTLIARLELDYNKEE